jgi:hypothetical protein
MQRIKSEFIFQPFIAGSRPEMDPAASTCMVFGVRQNAVAHA